MLMCSIKSHNEYGTCYCEGGIITGPHLFSRENIKEAIEISKTLEGPLAKLKRFLKEQEGK